MLKAGGTLVHKSREQAIEDLATYVQGWLDRHEGMKALSLANRVRETTGETFNNERLYGLLRRESLPDPDTLTKLSRAMGVSSGHLMLLAGYIDESDLQIMGFPPEAEEAVSILRQLQSSHPDVIEGWFGWGLSIIRGSQRGR